MKFSDLINIYRIKDWFHYLGFFFLGYFLYQSQINGLFILQIIEVSLILSYAYSLNVFFDKKMNRIYIVIPLFSLILSLIFLAFLNQNQIFLVIIFIILTTLYSIPKIRLKSFPIICSFSNNVGFSLLFLLGVSNNLTNSLTIKFFFLLFFLQSSAQFIHELAHIEKDKKECITTTPIFLGESRTKRIYSICLTLASIVSLTFIGNILSFLLLTMPTLLFSSYFIISINKIEINKLRKKYRNYGILIGLLFLLNNIII